MDLQSRKILFVQEFLNLQNEEIIQSLEELLHFKKIESADEQLKPMSLDQFNQQIEQSMKDSEMGRVEKATVLKSKYEK
ncbi:MAG TPA: hypothetical protein PKH79_13230 [Prolixibacteraceae bacterium]|nr:hypothetical protein [Prolixibacteraceae bacterium]HPS12139.1 hypothetical protein [Prolixibacteraceae bacterium]